MSLPDNVDQEIWDKVRVIFQDSLEVDDDEVHFDAKVIEDLDAESIDFLDIAFQLERAFSIKIPRGEIERSARETGDDEGLNEDGTLTEDALLRLSDAMPEVPRENFTVGLRPADIPNLFVVGTFYNLVIRLLNEKQ